MSSELHFEKIIFDFDGVLFDTNLIKKEAIYDAALLVTKNRSLTDTFVDYFTQNNGVPRELKVKEFFEEEIIQRRVLCSYEAILSERLLTAKPTNGALELLSFLSETNVELFILSGGSKVEIFNILRRFKLIFYFKSILTGPVDKISNAKERLTTGSDYTMIGDSLIDFEVSKTMGWDFYFMTAYSDLNLEVQPINVKKITNLKEIHEKIKNWY
jgi:phosphoglycolate phosphatase-like HAD superfamily hydrolase